MPHVVDWPTLVEHLGVVQRHHGLSDRALAEELGLASFNTFTRLRHGDRVSADVLATIVAWLYPNQIPTWIREVSPAEPLAETPAADTPRNVG